MANKTAWANGNGPGLNTWTTAINSADLVNMPSGRTVLSTVADFDNGTFLDQFMDISVRLAIASSTIVGGNITLFIYPLLDDAATYGDGQLPTPGVQTAITPTVPSCGDPIALPAGGGRTALVGMRTGILLPPQRFRLALQQTSSFPLSAGTQIVKIKTYNMDLNR